MCHSPHHAASVPLILSTQTELLSPQFHCIYDDTFDTIKMEKGDTSVWQREAHLTKTTENVNDDATKRHSCYGSNMTNNINATALPS